MKILSYTLTFLLCLSACNMAPKYARPDLPLPNSFRLDGEAGDTLANASWWKHLGDEVLDSFVQIAIENNRDLEVAVFRVAQYLANYQIVRSALFPDLSGGMNAIKEKLPANANFLPSGASSITPDFGMILSTSYEFDFWGMIRNETAAAYAGYLASIENRKVVLLSLVGTVVQGYVFLRQLDAQLSLSRSILGSRKESLEIARARFEGGLTSEIEVDQALSVYEEALATVYDLEKTVPQQENLLCTLLGQVPHTLPRGKTLGELVLSKEVPAGQPSDLLTRRPDIQKAEQELMAAYANIGVARAAFFPQITFGALYGVNSLQLGTLIKKTARTWGIGGTLLQSIFSGGALTGQLKVAEAQQKELIAHYEQTILVALKEVNNALIGLQQTQKVFAADEREVAALKGYLQLAWYRYYEGETEYLTVLDAERRVFNAELDMVAAQADQFFALVDLYKAVAGGWVAEADADLVQVYEQP